MIGRPWWVAWIVFFLATILRAAAVALAISYFTLRDWWNIPLCVLFVLAAGFLELAFDARRETHKIVPNACLLGMGILILSSVAHKLTGIPVLSSEVVVFGTLVLTLLDYAIWRMLKEISAVGFFAD